MCADTHRTFFRFGVTIIKIFPVSPAKMVYNDVCFADLKMR